MADLSQKFIRIALLAMLDSPRLPELVAKIQQLPEPTQQVVGALMQEMVDWDPDDTPTEESGNSHPEEDSNTDGIAPQSLRPNNVDRRAEILQLEERYAEVKAGLERSNRDNEILETELQAINESFLRLQETNVSSSKLILQGADRHQDALNCQIGEKDELLKKQKIISNGWEQSSVRDLESKISQQEEIIAGKEAQLTALQSTTAELQHKNQKLRASSEEVQKLKDELHIMKPELEKQTRKANTADNYVRKLQNSQLIEKERDALRQELEDTRKEAAATEKVRLDNLALTQSNDETSRTLSQIEQDFEELRMTNKHLRISRDNAMRQVEAFNERFAQDQETIAELRDRQAGPVSPKSPGLDEGLEGELLHSSEHESDMYASRYLVYGYVC